MKVKQRRLIHSFLLWIRAEMRRTEGRQVQMSIDRMRELLRNMVDVQELKQSKELLTSIEDDAKRQNLDTVKKRAAAQNVDYPAFAALVSCAHLKPMTRKELDNRQVKDRSDRKSNPAWSFDPTGHRQEVDSWKAPTTRLRRDATAIHLDLDARDKPGLLVPEASIAADMESPLSCFGNPLFEGDALGLPSTDENPCATTATEQPGLSDSTMTCAARRRRTWDAPAPQAREPYRGPFMQQKLAGPAASQPFSYTCDNFVKEWRRLNPAHPSERLIFLSRFAPSSLPVLFRVEIPPFLLGEILETLCVSLPRKDSPDKESEPQAFSQCAGGTEARAVDDGFVSKLLNHVGEKNHDLPSKAPTHRACEDWLSDAQKVYVHWVASVMDALRNCGRFGLAIKLMGQKARRTAADILDYIANTLLDPTPFRHVSLGSVNYIDEMEMTWEDVVPPSRAVDVITRGLAAEHTADHILTERVTRLQDAYCSGH